MFKQILAFGVIVMSSFILAIGQTPEKKKDAERIERTFAFTLDGNGGYLGVQTEEVNKDNFTKFGLSAVRGVGVEKVMEGSPAAAAGILANDVIVSVNGDEVTSTRKLTRLVSEIAPDHQAAITVLRGGREQQITATIGKRPTPKFGDGNFSFSIPEWKGKIEMPELKGLEEKLKNLPKDGPQVFGVPGGEGKAYVWRAGEGRMIGIGITPLTKQLAEHFKVDDGVMINSVRDGSPAAKAGLKAGDIIVDLDGNAVKSELDLIRGINEKKDGDVQVTVVRDGRRQTISVTPEKSKDAGFFFRNDEENGMMPALPSIPMAAPRAPTAPISLLGFGRVI
ncbi:MAG: PDZ domain-containing protein [Chloracidobacterium sp.]|nr:PDZ domain-containing protein [Chloracidobacterium sp.]